MTASFTTRRILCTVLAATLVALPANEALAAPAATPTATKPPVTSSAPAPGTAPASTPPADRTTGTARRRHHAARRWHHGATPTDPAATNPDGTPVDAPVDAVPEEPKPEEPKPEEVAPAPAPVVPEGPERPPEPTIGNGKYKAKGTGLMIAGGTLFGVGLAGVLTTYFLTRCPRSPTPSPARTSSTTPSPCPRPASLALLGAVLLFVGVGYHVRYKRWERWTPESAAKKKTALTPTMLRGGAGLSYTVKF
jgi:hypothetical protein